MCIVKGSLEVKLPTIWTDEKQSREEAGRRERLEERRSEKRKIQKKADADARKGRKVAKHYVFPMICGSGWSKSRLAKAAGAEPAGQMRDEKVHAVVVRSTFRSQNTPWSDHFWKLRCRKSARRCGAKHISKSKCTKHTMVGPLFEVEMSKRGMPLWREAHFEFRSQNARNTPLSDQIGSWDMLRCRKSAHRCGAKHISKSKHTMVGPLLEVEMSKKCTPVARSTFRSQNVQNTAWSDHFLKLRCRKSARRCGAKHISNFEVKMHETHHCRTKLEVEMSKKCTPWWCEAHFEVKTHHGRTTFGSWDVEKVHAVVARSTFRSQNVQCGKSARRCGAKHMSKSKC